MATRFVAALPSPCRTTTIVPLRRRGGLCWRAGERLRTRGLACATALLCACHCPTRALLRAPDPLQVLLFGGWEGGRPLSELLVLDMSGLVNPVPSTAGGGGSGGGAEYEGGAASGGGGDDDGTGRGGDGEAATGGAGTHYGGTP